MKRVASGAGCRVVAAARWGLLGIMAACAAGPGCVWIRAGQGGSHRADDQPAETKAAARPSVVLIVDDDRLARRDDWAFHEGVYFVPILAPCATDESYYPTRSLWPEIAAAVEATETFGSVLPPWADRASIDAAPYRLRVALLDTERTETTTAYLLGPVGLLLHLIGAPAEYTRSRVRLWAQLTTRDGAIVARGEGEDSEYGFLWIYEDSDDQEDLEEAVETALWEAMGPVFNGDVRLPE